MADRNVHSFSDKLDELNYCIHKLNNMFTIIQGNAELIKIYNNFHTEAEEILVCCKKSMELLESLRVLVND